MSRNRRHYSAQRILFLAIFCLSAIVPAHAHDPGLSSLEWRMSGGQLVAFIGYAPSDIEPLVTMDADRNGTITEAEFAAAKPKLEALAQEMLAVQCNGQIVAPLAATAQLSDANSVQFYVMFTGAECGQLNLRSLILSKLARGHRQLLSLRGAQDQVLAERMLDAVNDTFAGDVAALAAEHTPQHTFWEFFKLGVEHIFTGYDHLLFLLALLLIVGSLGEAIKIITSFTIAHSITLAVATLGWVNVPSNIVEPLIAASIIYVGLENLVRKEKEIKRRWLLTFFFGLIHGFGFAGVLRELGIGASGGVAVPLVSFNLGVEIGQIAIAALVLPLIWKLRERPAFATRYAPACSVLVTLAGAYWLLERTLL